MARSKKRKKTKSSGRKQDASAALAQEGRSGSKKKTGFGKRGDKRALDRLTKELSQPERLVSEATKLVELVRRGEALQHVRFPAARVIEALGSYKVANEEDMPADESQRAAGLVDLLIDDEFRAQTKSALDAELGGTEDVKAGMPYIVGSMMISPEAEKEGGTSPLWTEIFRLSLVEAPFILWLESRLGDGDEALRELAASGALRADLDAFLDQSGHMGAVHAVFPDLDLNSVLVQLLLHFDEHELILPLEAVLHGPMEEARSVKRQQALARAGAGRGHADVALESMRSFGRAFEKDQHRALPAFRAVCLAKLDIWLLALRTAVPEERPIALRRAVLLMVALLGLEVLPHAQNYAVAATYQTTFGRAATYATPEERDYLEDLLRSPMDSDVYRGYAEWLLGEERPELALVVAEIGVEAGGDLGGLIAQAEAAIAKKAPQQES
ncbi:hypothetical protein ACFL59_04210 [Planctomycetota bacterium]